MNIQPRGEGGEGGAGGGCVAYPSSQGNKWRLRLVQFNGLFNNPRTLSHAST